MCFEYWDWNLCQKWRRWFWGYLKTENPIPEIWKKRRCLYIINYIQDIHGATPAPLPTPIHVYTKTYNLVTEMKLQKWHGCGHTSGIFKFSPIGKGGVAWQDRAPHRLKILVFFSKWEEKFAGQSLQVSRYNYTVSTIFLLDIIGSTPSVLANWVTVHCIWVVVVVKPFEIDVPRLKKPTTFFSILLSFFAFNILVCSSLFWLFCESLLKKLDNVIANCFLLKLLPHKRDAICIHQTMCSLITQD